ncbi:MAG: M48 family metalloprotease, partial [Ottowia sp.]|nr:M48 family metalloprotease [Ottowia sp.]
MRFFDHQLDARARTRRLRLAFLLAVIGTVAGMHLALAVPFVLVRLLAGVPAEVIYPRGFLWVNIATPLMLILGGWWIESSNTRHGVRLAERLGARAAQPGSRLAEQRLANIVQEMSIAAHMPPPAALVLPREAAINAFASGMEPSDWAVTVTEGALEYLTRDELMGLVAHELSHLREGDTALNMRL